MVGRHKNIQFSDGKDEENKRIKKNSAIAGKKIRIAETVGGRGGKNNNVHLNNCVWPGPSTVAVLTGIYRH